MSANSGVKRASKAFKTCLFCKRSHVVCDKQRPCSRCVKRDIAHLCREDDIAVPNEMPSQHESSPNDNNIQGKYANKAHTGIPSDYQNEPVNKSGSTYGEELSPKLDSSLVNDTTSLLLPQQPVFVSENVGSEFSSLNEFLSMLENPLLTQTSLSSSSASNVHLENGSQTTQSPLEYQNDNRRDEIGVARQENRSPTIMSGSSNNISKGDKQDQEKEESRILANANENSAPTPKEQFFLTAADPSTEMTPEHRLKLVINAKLEAGLLKPYNYAKGYARLQDYMDKYMNQSSKQRILKPLSTIRPAFRTIARSLKDVDLVLVEESFERMLLSYDRVFTSMSMPACLCRRTGEIYRANKEFASLVDCTVDDLRDGKLAIYELMTEESAVNFWEKYGSIAFDKGQKAVLTSCSLRTKDGIRKRPCCFSFTIRRDRYNIPICIVGNFIPLS
ncbi:Rds2p [Saccharomyces cerevisiae P283]|uniref:Rds2p n=1 Tax=Saccharomyces cerevisiae (strain Lalvin EC1118 / Prise de mousse) TaxID=643680 RepID=C8ZIP7_YEAS8|nr:Rds2p [Saccharomyces cerevisiae YJM1574]EGA80457.1 Rds2p [Saccharomyces cerevisiae Lalvin QA23]EWH15752.1 Rds2p [Saccharomyces cerevisiae P283]CAY86828.1 Rds2p [Saccharomyces cerevisiae EC1118]